MDDRHSHCNNLKTSLPQVVASSAAPAAIMANSWVFRFILLLGVTSTALSISYNSLGFPQRGSVTCQKLLKKLNGSALHCLQDRMNFEVPEKIKHPQHFQKEEAALVIYEMLHQIFGIFTGKYSSTGWSETIVENLLAELFWQMDHLETILEEKLEEESSPQLDFVTVLHLKSYYLRIVRYLKDKGYSSCAWTVVREEILKNFSFIIQLTEYLPK
ncbi:interferon beta-like [Tamandua tetradactyla]|uniref:interferon beta-like n=1 Tax=Tamandua tetradactyla TaxID=48850 RepID=UPI004053AAD7